MMIVILADCIAVQEAGIHYYGLQLVRKICDENPDADLLAVVPFHTEALQDLPIKQEVVKWNRQLPFHLRWRQLRAIPRRVRSLQPDLVIELAHFGPFGLKNTGIKTVTVVHDITPITHPQFHNRLSNFFHRTLFPKVLHSSHHILVNSASTQDALIDRFQVRPQEIQIVYPAISQPADHEFNTTPLPYCPYFLVVGTLEPRKNIHLIIEAFEHFHQTEEASTTQLILVGAQGWKQKPLMKQISQSPFRERIILTGRVSRSTLWSYYRGALALVIASVEEGFGLPIIEAFCNSCPVLASDIPVFREIGGNAVRYFSVSQSEDLKHLMTKMVREQGSLNSMKTAAKARFDHLQTINQEIGLAKLVEKKD